MAYFNFFELNIGPLLEQVVLSMPKFLLKSPNLELLGANILDTLGDGAAGFHCAPSLAGTVCVRRRPAEPPHECYSSSCAQHCHNCCRLQWVPRGGGFHRSSRWPHDGGRIRGGHSGSRDMVMVPVRLLSS
jgi:hypothetical protein